MGGTRLQSVAGARRSQWRLLALSFATAIALVPSLAAAPAQAAPRSSPTPRTKSLPSLAAGKPVDVTLVTGDRVTYREDSGGRSAAVVTAGPGREGVDFHIRSDQDGYYVVPGDAEPDLLAGLVDKRLFDVKYLATNGYADAAVGEVPVIVQYREPAAAPAERARSLPHAGSPLDLPSVNGAGVQVEKRRAGDFWDAVHGPAAPSGRGQAAGAPSTAAPATSPRLGQGLSRVWLDVRVRAADDVSDPQIGAPVAWAAGFDGTGTTVGIIDTGIDQTHPDLQGKVVAAQNFVPTGQPGGGDPNDVTDHNGHGTHVASILAGTGAASAGRYRGVAPGARLTIAKALNDNGSAPDSWILAAMQWQAATEHARIVSMSLGGPPTDGTDPLSQAVDNLTAQFGTLFVIAAGNSGPASFTVAAPGAAAAALTVGAVDSADKLADFSSRGPRLGDFAVKPEITAPGVGIVAARAAGTSLGQPVGTAYTRLSGTSMATPHVAASAAILGQQHPDWTAGQLKSALIATAHDDGLTAYEQGGGRVDVGRGVTATVFDDTASVSGLFTFPYTGETLTRDVTYRNTGKSAVTLTLSSSAVRADGSPAAPGMVSVSPTTLTVPAGGTAAARLTIEPGVGDPGIYTGALRAGDAAGDQVSVPIGFRKGARLRAVDIRLIGGPDTKRTDLGPLFLGFQLVNDTEPALSGDPTIAAGAVVPDLQPTQDAHTFETTRPLLLADGGVYLLELPLLWWDGTSGRYQVIPLVDPEVAVGGDTTVTFDLNKVVPLRVDTQRPSEVGNRDVYWSRTHTSGAQFLSGFLSAGNSNLDYGALPSSPVTVGRFAFWFNDADIAAQAPATLQGGGEGRIELHTQYVSQGAGVPKFTTDQELRVITTADLRAGRDGRGRLVLVQPPSLERLDPATLPDLVADLDLARDAGAAGVLTDSPDALFVVTQYFRDHVKIPVLWIHPAEAARVARALAGEDEPEARIQPQLDDPYEYKLAYYMLGSIPNSLVFKPVIRDLTAITSNYHVDLDAQHLPWTLTESDITFRNDGPGFAIASANTTFAPTSRVEYYDTTGPDVLWSRFRSLDDFIGGTGRIATSQRGFTSPTTTSEDWNAAIIPAQVLAGPQYPTGFFGTYCGICRQNDTLRFRTASAVGVAEVTDSGDHSLSSLGEASTDEMHLFQGDTELTPQLDGAGLPFYDLPAGDATYRATDTIQNAIPGLPHVATRIDTTWTFHSSRPTSGNASYPYYCLDTLLFGDTHPCAWQPVIFLNYRLGLALDDTAPAGRVHRFTVSAEQGPPASAARLASLRLWSSSDGGAHWTPAVVVPAAGNAFQVLVRDQALAPGQEGTVSLRAEARDAAGNSVVQTIFDAYKLRAVRDDDPTAAGRAS